jgi:hypothetical protein
VGLFFNRFTGFRCLISTREVQVVAHPQKLCLLHHCGYFLRNKLITGLEQSLAEIMITNIVFSRFLHFSFIIIHKYVWKDELDFWKLIPLGKKAIFYHLIIQAPCPVIYRNTVFSEVLQSFFKFHSFLFSKSTGT